MEKEVYTKERVYEILNGSETNTIFKIIWEGRNGTLDAMVRFEGFDKDKKPRLIQVGETLLDIEKLDHGYNSIKSLGQESPDGYCAAPKSCGEAIDELSMGIC